jgi:hypothetical protein
MGDGRIDGYCTTDNAGNPVVNLMWSQNPPPNTGAATMNALQKGDCFVNDPNTYWCFLQASTTQHAYADTSVTPDTQYQYRVQYGPTTWSVNTFNIYTSSRNCGVLPPAAGPLSLSPTYQTVPPNVTAIVTATGGDGNYAWSAPTGTINGAGSTVGVVFTNVSTDAVTKTITVQSGTGTASVTVLVEGIQTFKDDISLTGRGSRFVLINNDAPVASSSDVLLTLGHGFTSEATVSVTMKLGNSDAALASAVEQPFQKFFPWNLCSGLSLCGDGMYTVYAEFVSPRGVTSPVVMDNIVFLKNPTGDKPSVTINNGATETEARLVTLALSNGLKGIPADQVTMQIANRSDLVDAARMTPYSPTLSEWDICAGLGSSCVNGARTVYVKFCAGATCTAVVQDDILLQSPWPDWGVAIDDNAVSTGSNLVQLHLNPWFDKPETLVLLSNTPDFSVLATAAFNEHMAWDLCYGLTVCTPGTATVYVRYENNSKNAAWPSMQSPRYEDDILIGATPTPTATPLPAGIYINNGATQTTSRTVNLTFASPFGSGPGVTMRPINEHRLSVRDRDIIDTRGGGIESQPGSNVKRYVPTPMPPVRQDTTTPTPTTANGTYNPSAFPAGYQGQTLFADAAGVQTNIPELDSGAILAFKDKLTGWDLCEGLTECPYGTYKVFVQYYRATGVAVVSTTLAALGDEVSDVYYDTIDYVAPTPTPSPSPTPSGSVSPSPELSGSPAPTTSPTTPTGGIIDIVPGWAAPAIESITQTLAGSAGTISQISIASSVAVAATAALAVVPILGSAGAGAFMWQGFMAMLGLLPKRKKVWGTVYDANTKRPIPFAKVQLLDRNRRVLETRIADKDGRYGFLTTPESLLAQNVQILILPIAKEYAFPSHTAATVDTFVYNNLYYGDLITVSDQKLINFDIPMDPIRPSVVPLMLKSPSIVLGASVAAIADAGFWLGLVMIPLNAIITPTPFTFGVMFLFLGTASLRIWGIREHPFGTVTDSATGRPMPFALITLNDLAGKRAGFTVTDEQGRYFLVAERGTYELTIFTPGTVVPPRQAKQMIEARKGWITRQLKL